MIDILLCCRASCPVATTRPSGIGRAPSSDAIPFPQSEPRIVRVYLVMALICSIAIGQLERSGVRQCVHTLEQFDFRDGLLDIHALLFEILMGASGQRFHGCSVHRVLRPQP